MQLNWTETTLTAIIVFLATIIQGFAGFGQSLLLIGLLPLFRNPGSASILVSIVAVISNAHIWWSVRDNFRWKDCTNPGLGLILGLPIGIWLFKYLDETQLRIAIGITLLLAVILIALIDQLPFVKEWIKRTGYKPGWMMGVFAGFLGGLLGGAVATPGPPMVLYGVFMLSAGFWNGRQMKAVFAAYFGTIQLIRVISLAVTGDVTVSHLTESVIILPGLILGTWVGIRIFNMVPQKIFGWIVLGLLIINAIVLLA